MRLAALSIVAAFFLCLTPAVAQDDSPAALRKQIDQLTEQIAELEATVERSKTRIDALVDENRRLRDTIKSNKADNTNGDNTTTDTPEDAGPAEIPADPFASPASLRAALVRLWNDEFEGVDVSDDNQSRQYLRDVRRWVSKAKRDHRGKFDWRATVVSARSEGRSTIAMIQVIDDEGRPIGVPAEIEATGSAARTVLQASTDAVLELNGNQSIDIKVDARMGEAEDQLGPYLATTIEHTVTTARYE